MSVHTGIQAARRTDSHGHCPQNRRTYANLRRSPPGPASSQLESAQKATQKDLVFDTSAAEGSCPSLIFPIHT